MRQGARGSALLLEGGTTRPRHRQRRLKKGQPCSQGATAQPVRLQAARPVLNRFGKGLRKLQLHEIKTPTGAHAFTPLSCLHYATRKPNPHARCSLLSVRTHDKLHSCTHRQPSRFQCSLRKGKKLQAP